MTILFDRKWLEIKQTEILDTSVAALKALFSRKYIWTQQKMPMFGVGFIGATDLLK